MKPVLISSLATVGVALSLAAPSFAGPTGMHLPSLQYPTNFDGYMSGKTKKSAQKTTAAMTKDR